MTDARHTRRLASTAIAVTAGVALGVAGGYALAAARPTASSAALTLPTTLGGMRPEADVLAEVSDVAGKRAQDYAVIRQELTESLSAAHGGATAVSASYMDDDMDLHVRVFAVAATSPALWSTQDSGAAADQMGLATPTEWVERFDDAECLVRPRELVRDVPDAPDVELLVLRCQLVDDDLTIVLDGSAPHLTLEQGLSLVREAADGVQRG